MSALLDSREGYVFLNDALRWESENEELAMLANMLVPARVSDSDGDPELHMIRQLRTWIGGTGIVAKDWPARIVAPEGASEIVGAILAKAYRGPIRDGNNNGLIYDGTEHEQPAPSNPNPMDNPNFRKWFGDSKVTNGDGSPMVVYHGTAAEFDSFDASRIGQTYDLDESGFYFTSSMEQAWKWAEYAAKERRKSGDKNAQPRVISAYLSADNPWTIEANTGPGGLSPVAHLESGEGQFNRGQQNTIDYAVSSGYNGLIIRDRIVDDFHEAMFVVFDPSQVKYAIGNDGAFDPDNPDMRKQYRGPIRDGNNNGLIYDGTEHEQPAPSNPNPMDNPNFRKWFGKSKIVDKEGKPLVVYHGTQDSGKSSSKAYDVIRSAVERIQLPEYERVAKIAASNVPKKDSPLYQRLVGGGKDAKRALDEYISIVGEDYGSNPIRGMVPANRAFVKPFDFAQENADKLTDEELYWLDTGGDYAVFDSEKLGATSDDSDAKMGFFFTPSREFAAQFTYKIGYNPYTGHKWEEPGAKPKVMEVYLRAENPLDLRKVRRDEAGKVAELLGYDAEEVISLSRSAAGSKQLQLSASKAKDKLIAAGYDSVLNLVKDRSGKSTQEFIVFDPGQIKSATENTGEFRRDSKDIRKQYRGPIRDGNNNGLIYDGTQWEQPAPEIPEIIPPDLRQNGDKLGLMIKSLLEDEPESEAEVDADADSERAADRLGWSTQDFASMVGAPDDSYVTVRKRYEGIRIDIEHDDIERCHRYLTLGPDGKFEIKNEELFLFESAQGKGTGLAMLSKQVAHAARLGISKIKTYGAKDAERGITGYAVWPIMGYDSDLSGWKEGWRLKIAREFPDAKSMQDIMDAPGGREWWTEHGTGVQLEFDLSEGSRSVAALARYRNKKRGIIKAFRRRTKRGR